MAAPGTARGAAPSVPATLPRKQLGAGRLPALHRWRLQRKLFGAALGKAEAATPADGRAGHRKGACSIEAAAGME